MKGYGKIIYHMKTNLSEQLPNPPSLIASLVSGFDAVTTHIALILFPAALDLFIWLGPHIKIEKLIRDFTAQLSAITAAGTPDSSQLIQANQDIWDFMAQHFNLMFALRSYPVGVPSLMASRLPVQAPAGLLPKTLDISSFLGVLGIVLILSIFGLVLGALYYVAVANASIPRPKNWLDVLKSWPRAALQVLLLALFWSILLLVVSVPSLSIISLLALGSPLLGRLGMLVYGAGLIWLIFPLLLSPYGIFINQDNVVVSLKKGLRLTRMTLPTTGMLFLSVIVISQGLDLLWNAPADNSWFTLIGILGHAFVTTGLLSTTFVYYRKADRWIQAVIAHWVQNPPANLKV